MNAHESILHALMGVIEDRKENPRERSYTNQLLAAGIPRIVNKLREESGELAEAAGEDGEEGRAHFIYEACDLIYHTWVLLSARGVSLAEIETELGRRFGVSGLDEKASRTQGHDHE